MMKLILHNETEKESSVCAPWTLTMDQVS